MKTAKKILIITLSLLAVILISTLFAFSASYLGFSFWGIFLLMAGLQIIVPTIVEFVYEKYILYKHIKNYADKDYKAYVIETVCQHCGRSSNLELDLNDTEYQCANCGKHNAVHVTFLTAAIPTPIDTHIL